MRNRKIDTSKELNRELGPEYVLFKNTGYSEEPYIEGWTSIQMANRIFGYDGWTSQILSVEMVSMDKSAENRVSVSAMAHIRITLKNGIFREDIGFGISENVKGQGKAKKIAYKSSITDGIKRTLKQFGKALGSCCNDTNYIKQIKRIKKIDRQIDINGLIRPGSSPIYTEEEIAEEKETLQTEISSKPQPAVKKTKSNLDKPVDNQKRKEEILLEHSLPSIDEFMSSA